MVEVLVKNKTKIHGKAKFIFGGDGETDKLKKIIEQESLGELIEFVGWVDGNQKIDLLNNSNVFILPSYNEGLPIAILEAMSYGLAIISTNVGGIPEIVNQNGILINPGDKIKLTEAIFRYINNDYYTESKVSQKIVKEYYPDAVKENLKSIYLNILN